MRAFIGKSLSYGLYRFGIVEAEGMKAIKGSSVHSRNETNSIDSIG